MPFQRTNLEENSPIAMPRGTDLAMRMDDRGRPGRCARPAPSARRLRRWLALVWLLATASCVVPAPTADPPAEKSLLLIAKAKVMPSTLTPKTISRADSVLTEFSVAGAIYQQGETAGPFTSWYYDYDDSRADAMSQSQVCGSLPVCKPLVCKFDPGEEVHTLMVVVSNQQLVDSPKNPLDFPLGTAFDKVEWRIKLEGVCPVP